MIRLNRLTDYGVVLMVQLSRSGDRVLTARQMSAETGVPLPTVAKILKQLTSARLVISQRGAGGGYALGRPADDISAGEIVAVLEGPVVLTACVESSLEHCRIESQCPMCGNWNKVNLAIQGALEAVTLADMAEPALPFAERVRAGLELRH